MSPISESAPPAADPSTTSLSEMLRIYEVCVRIRDVTKQQLSLSDDMALIAINAEIAAAKSEANQEAFMILASETGRIAAHMSTHVDYVLRHADTLARQALQGVVNARRLTKVAEALPGLKRAGNVRHVEGVLAGLQQTLTTLMAEIQASRLEVERTRQALDKQHQRVSRIITYFRIEASRDVAHGGYFRNIADDLSALIGLANAISGELQVILKGGYRINRQSAPDAPPRKGGQ